MYGILALSSFFTSSTDKLTVVSNPSGAIIWLSRYWKLKVVLEKSDTPEGVPLITPLLLFNDWPVGTEPEITEYVIDPAFVLAETENEELLCV